MPNSAPARATMPSSAAASAARMSAFAGKPGAFPRLGGRAGYPDRVVPDGFLPRNIYGDHIASVFAEARAHAPDTVRFISTAVSARS